MEEGFNEEDALLTVPQVADLLQLCTKTVYNRIKDGSLDAFKVDHKSYRIRYSAIEKYISILQPRGNNEREAKTHAKDEDC